MDLNRRFLGLALVNVLSNLMVPLAGLIDLAFLGHLSDLRHLAGVAVATVLFNYIYWMFGFLRMGTTGMTAQAMGRADPDEATVILLRNLGIALALGSIILVLREPLAALGFALLAATDSVEASGRAFFDGMVLGAPATLLNYVLVGWFLGREQSSRVLVLTGVASGANIALDALFILRWGWASAGAGLATATSQYLMLAVGLALVAPQVKFAGLRALIPRLLAGGELRALFVLNRDLLVRTLALVSVFAAFTNLGAAMGTVVLAANSLLLQAVTLGAYFIDGFAFATESLAGFYRGKSNPALQMRLLRLSGALSLACGLAFACAFVLLPGLLFGLITDHAEVIGAASQFVPWLGPMLGFGSIAWMLDGYFLGLTEGARLRRSSLIAAAVFVPVAALAWLNGNNHLLWLAFTLFTVARAATLAIQVPATLGPRPL